MVLAQAGEELSTSSHGQFRQPFLLARDGVLLRGIPAAGVRELGAAEQPHADQRVRTARGPLLPGLRVRPGRRGRHPGRPLPVGPGRRTRATEVAAMTLDAPAVLSLIATAGAFVAFLVMLQESIAVGRGQ